MGKISVFLESEEDLTLYFCGRELARQKGCELVPICLDVVQTENLAFEPVRRIYRLPTSFDETMCAAAIAALCREEEPAVLLFPATVFSRMTAPMVAAELQAALVADCTGLEWSAEGLIQTRPAYGSSYLAAIRSSGATAIATVRRGTVGSRSDNALKTEPTIFSVSEVSEKRWNKPVLVDRIPKKNQQTLYNAEIVVAGGRGVGSADGFRLLEELAVSLSGSLAASRAAVNDGFAPYRCQVGLTGQIVRPRLYLAFGISGAVQHLVGMEQAKTVIAVNRDKDAPIFSHADFGLVADWEKTALRLLECARKQILSPTEVLSSLSYGCDGLDFNKERTERF